jgi:hypothetical protein
MMSRSIIFVVMCYRHKFLDLSSNELVGFFKLGEKFSIQLHERGLHE